MIRNGAVTHQSPTITAGIIVAIRDLNVLSHKKLKGIEQISNPRSKIHDNINTITNMHPNVITNPDAYTKMQVYKNIEPIQKSIERILEYINAPNVRSKLIFTTLY